VRLINQFVTATVVRLFSITTTMDTRLINQFNDDDYGRASILIKTTVVFINDKRQPQTARGEATGFTLFAI
jgi:hypothetical protein